MLNKWVKWDLRSIKEDGKGQWVRNIFNLLKPWRNQIFKEPNWHSDLDLVLPKVTEPKPVWPDLAKIRQFSKNLEILDNIVKVNLMFGKVVNPCLGLFVCFWAKFHRCKWPNIEKTIWPSGHTDQNFPPEITLINDYVTCWQENRRHRRKLSFTTPTYLYFKFFTS